jgi:hypothetical protein
VDDDSVIFKRFNVKNRYDSATVTFRAKQGKLIDLQKMHESIWATRLSGGTRSGVICLEVTVEGTVSQSGDKTFLQIDGTDQRFVLVSDVRAKPEGAKAGAFKAVIQAVDDGQMNVSITGFVDGWVGRWPGVLARPAAKQPQLMVTGFQPVTQKKK